jgi:TatD DNase family protein
MSTVYCSVGTHPHNAGEETDVTAEHLVRLARHPKVVGIGEAGLDYHYDFSPREAQARASGCIARRRARPGCR